MDLPAPNSIVSDALGGNVSLSALDRAIRQDIISVSLLDAVKRELLAILAAPSGKRDLTGIVLDQQAKNADSIALQATDIVGRIDSLEEIILAAPAYVANKTAFLEFEDKYRKAMLEASKFSADQPTILDRLAGQGLISQSDVDEFKSITSTRDADRKSLTQTVNQLRDRYYTVSSGYSATKGGNTSSISIEGIEDVGGNTPITFSPSGSIVIGGSEKRVVPRGRVRRPRAPVLPQVTPASDLYYEVVSCAMLDLAEYISNLISAINSIIDKLNSAASFLTSLKLQVNLGKLLPISDKTLGEISLIKKSINGILDIPSLGNRSIGVGVSLSIRSDEIPSGNGQKTICQINKDQYCQIHESLINMERNLKVDLEGISLSIGSSVIDFDIDAMIDSIKNFSISISPRISKSLQLAEKLRGDLCLFISRKVKAVPNSLIELRSTLSSLITFIGSYPSFSASIFGIDISQDMLDYFDRLNKIGMGLAAEFLGSGDINSILEATSPEDNTGAGATAKCLEASSGDDVGVLKSAQISILAGAARTRGKRQVCGADVRQSMIGRFGQDLGRDTAKTVAALGITLVGDL